MLATVMQQEFGGQMQSWVQREMQAQIRAQV